MSNQDQKKLSFIKINAVDIVKPAIKKLIYAIAGAKIVLKNLKKDNSNE